MSEQTTASRPHRDGSGDTFTCKHCRKPIVRCDSVPGQHIGCSSGHGWIHSNPEQWGHSCQPRSGAPYALPVPVRFPGPEDDPSGSYV